MAIPELHKAPRARCQYQCSTGCAIYGTRPTSCAGFLCLWRQGWGTSADRPDRTGIVVEMKDGYATLAEFGGGARVFAVRTMSDDRARDHQVRAIVQEFLGQGAVGTVVAPSGFVLYGPRFPEGHPLSSEEFRAIEQTP